MSFNFIWTKPGGHGSNNQNPTVRFSKSICTLNNAALRLLPEDTEYVELGIDCENNVIAIRKSENVGRKLSKKPNTTYQTFSCTGFIKEYADIEHKAYSAQNEDELLIVRYK